MPSSFTRRSLLRTVSASVVGLSGCTALGSDGPRTHDADAPLDADVDHPWPTLYGDSRRRSYRSEPVSLPADARGRSFTEAGKYIRMQPIIGSDSVLFGAQSLKQSRNRTFSGLRSVGTSSGKTRWTVEETRGIASPTVVGNAVFVTSAGTTRALDRRDGSLCWAYEFGYGHPTNTPSVVDGRVYASGDGVMALDGKTGERLWAAGRGDGGIAGTAATDSVVVATSIDDDGGVSAFDPGDGTVRWTAEFVGPSYSPPVIETDTVHVVETGGVVRALSLRSGDQRWERPLGNRSYASPSVGPDTIVVGATNGRELYALDSRTGDVEWTYEFGPRVLKTPTIGGSFIYLPLAGGDGTIDVIDRTDGTRRARLELPGLPSSGVALTDELLAVSSGERDPRSEILTIDD
ncbi:hypothetical protein BRD03_02945 [Halobacteriales archaeon QS_9_68_17]|nr:MAG: hypothetical protein BRD03_02945 [Halobacteriales archaeon QS_9_68_17]